MKQSRYILLILALLLLTALACGVGGGDEATAEPTVAPTAETEPETQPTDVPPTDEPAPADTAEPAPTDTPPEEPTKAPAATKAPAPTKAPSTASLELETTPFVHPLGYLSLYPPQGWAAESSDGGATFAAPDDSGFINVEATNNGVELDGESFESFVDAREINLFGTFDGYDELDYQIDRDSRVARVTKALLFDGLPQIVTSIYDQRGAAVFAIDFWADEDLEEAYSPAYQEIIDTASVDGDIAASEVDTFYWIYDFTGPGNLFTIEVPIHWSYELSEGETTIVDTFYSPDRHAIVQNLAYDDGEEVSRSVAGAFALELLKSYYADDIRITDDQVQTDGSERLIWNSPSGSFSGISFLETRGTTFLLFSVLWDDPYEDAYFDVLDAIISTYDIP